MSDIKIVWDGAALERLHAINGPIFDWLDKQSFILREICKEEAPVDTGCLRERIVRRPIEETAGTLSFRIVSSTSACSQRKGPPVEYALFVHNGTQPHDIPNAFGYGPQFGIGGRFSGKFHPGNKANPYLTRGLAKFAARVR